MGESENKPSIHIHLDQQVTIEAIRGQEEVEDATVATEITGFDVEQDLYVLRGALSFTGFLRQEDPTQKQLQIPDELDDRDVFATAEEVAEAPVLPFHYRLPFILQVPVAAQQSHQREEGILNVNPRIGQWNVHVLGPETLHLRAELVIQGLTGLDGYVFRCGSQEEGAVASKLDHLLDQEEARAFTPPHGQDLAGKEFEAPFAPWPGSAGADGEGTLYAEQRRLHELADSAAEEDDWVIETPKQQQEQAAPEPVEEVRGEADWQEDAEEEEETQIIFTPDPSIVFPMPAPGSNWALELEAADRAFGSSVQEASPFSPVAPFPSVGNSLSAQPPAFEAPLFERPMSESLQPFGAESHRAQEADDAVREAADDAWVSDDDAFVVESTDEPRAVEEYSQETYFDNSEAERSEADHSDAEHSDVERTEAESLDPVESVETVETEREPQTLAYEFEDEVPPQEVESVIETDGFSKFAPKLSFGSKSVEKLTSGEPIKLSQLLGDSRTESVEVAKPFESPSFAESAQLIRESLSYGDMYAGEEGNMDAEQVEASFEAASVFTSSTGHGKESFWREILNGHEEKVTMKFRIVQEEDSLPMLAEHYHTTINELLRANNLQRQEVDAGQILYIPYRKR